MRTRRLAGIVAVCLAVTGCHGDGLSFRSLFDRDKGPDPSNLPAASPRAATRVVAVGSEIVAQNKDTLRFQPVFFTMGVPEIEVSHDKSGIVYLSEGLVERCPTDTELAAVICHELGKMAAERAARQQPEFDRTAPAFTRDVVGGTYEPDMTRLAEQAKFDRRTPRPAGTDRDPKADARILAESLFTRTGRKAEDLARMDQLIKQAEDNADKRASERNK
jgi:predicted Zn-dependent protease